MVHRTVTIQSENGLHTRPASDFVALIRNFKSEIRLVNGTIQANAKSMINLLTLNGKKGTIITVECQGEDEEEALETTCHFLSTFDY